MALSLLHIFAFSCLSRGFLAAIRVLLLMKAIKEEAWVLNLFTPMRMRRNRSRGYEKLIKNGDFVLVLVRYIL